MHCKFILNHFLVATYSLLVLHAEERLLVVDKTILLKLLHEYSYSYIIISM